MSIQQNHSGQLFDLLTSIGDHFLDCLTIVALEDEKRRCLYVNDRFVRHMGYSKKETVGKNLAFLQGPNTSAAAVQFMRASLNEKQACCIDILNYTRAGAAFINRLVMLPIRREDEGYFLGFQNVIETEVEEDQQVLSNVSHGEINHMLNNPLTQILATAELARFNGDLNDEVQNACEQTFAMINNYCRHIDRPERFSHYNPFR